MILDRTTGGIRHRRFANLPDELAPGDLLVLNDTKVFPARLTGTKPTGGEVELLLLPPVPEAGGGNVWSALISGSKSIRPGVPLALRGGVAAVPLSRDGEVWRVALNHDGRAAMAALEDAGEVPLPPYIRRDPADPRGALDRERYQTVFARNPGAVAAPTAGLHFTPELLDALAARGVETAFVTLHVGLGTFSPIRVTDVAEHRMHEESFVVPEETAAKLCSTRERGGRVVAVGTTVARTLETCATDAGFVLAGAGRSSLFIYPGFRFRVVEALVTNFHLPQSTLLMLVCAFAGTVPTLAAYSTAVAEGYRFFSYGDAMLLEDGR
jgi:S-adenosylmethionine:tRNA ribosyltransferase-isomerase